MLQRYRKDDFLRFPMTSGLVFYRAKTLDFIKADGSLVPVYYKDSVPFITLFFEDGPLELKLAVAIAIVTKQTFIFRMHWGLLDVMHVDGDKSNIHPSNLVWKHPSNGIPGRMSGFRSIPGYSRYSINRDGVIYSNMVCRELSSYVDSSGYTMYGLTPDVGKRTICGRHRLLALAFLEYPSEVDLLDVNHIDGVKSNNDIINLEWASRKRNCDHAYSSGLRDDNVEVLVKNVFSGEVVCFYSLEECARQMKLDGETVRLRVNGKQRLYYPGILMRKADSSEPWLEIKDPVYELTNSRLRIPILVKNLVTDEIEEFKSVTAVSEKIGAANITIRTRLDGSSLIPDIKGYKVYYPDFESRCLSDFAEMRN